jgi:hypothetical protein
MLLNLSQSTSEGISEGHSHRAIGMTRRRNHFFKRIVPFATVALLRQSQQLLLVVVGTRHSTS